MGSTPPSTTWHAESFNSAHDGFVVPLPHHGGYNVLRRLIPLSPWQDGGFFRHLALCSHPTHFYATTTLLTVFSTSCDMTPLPYSSCCPSLLHRISTSFIMYVFKSMSESPSSFQPVVDDPLFGVVNRGQVQYSFLGLLSPVLLSPAYALPVLPFTLQQCVYTPH